MSLEVVILFKKPWPSTIYINIKTHFGWSWGPDFVIPSNLKFLKKVKEEMFVVARHSFNFHTRSVISYHLRPTQLWSNDYPTSSVTLYSWVYGPFNSLLMHAHTHIYTYTLIYIHTHFPNTAICSIRGKILGEFFLLKHFKDI